MFSFFVYFLILFFEKNVPYICVCKDIFVCKSFCASVFVQVFLCASIFWHVFIQKIDQKINYTIDYETKNKNTSNTFCVSTNIFDVSTNIFRVAIVFIFCFWFYFFKKTCRIYFCVQGYKNTTPAYLQYVPKCPHLRPTICPKISTLMSYNMSLL